jgi:hypothetical protein
MPCLWFIEPGMKRTQINPMPLIPNNKVSVSADMNQIINGIVATTVEVARTNIGQALKVGLAEQVRDLLTTLSVNVGPNMTLVVANEGFGTVYEISLEKIFQQAADVHKADQFLYHRYMELVDYVQSIKAGHEVQNLLRGKEE